MKEFFHLYNIMESVMVSKLNQTLKILYHIKFAMFRFLKDYDLICIKFFVLYFYVLMP